MEAAVGAMVVRRSIVIDADPKRIWREFESADRMKQWFHCHRLLLQPWVGGHFETEGEHDGEPYVFGGKVLVWDPPRQLTVEWGCIPPQWQDVTHLTFNLAPQAEGRTRVEIAHHGFERLGERGQAIFEGFEGGWDLSELEGLKRVVEGN